MILNRLKQIAAQKRRKRDYRESMESLREALERAERKIRCAISITTEEETKRQLSRILEQFAVCRMRAAQLENAVDRKDYKGACVMRDVLNIAVESLISQWNEVSPLID